MPPESRVADGRRGFCDLEGWWISVEEATMLCQSEKWQKAKGPKGRTIELRQYDGSGPDDKPLWMFSNGIIYIGPWLNTSIGDERRTVENGFGMSIHCDPQKELFGLVYIGEWTEGERHGSGKSFFLENSPIWRKNDLLGSQIRESENGKPARPRPYIYEGTFEHNVKACDEATVTLKSGRCRRGRWLAGNPVGDWFGTHDVAKATTRDADIVPSKKSKADAANSTSRACKRKKKTTNDAVDVPSEKSRADAGTSKSRTSKRKKKTTADAVDLPSKQSKPDKDLSSSRTSEREKWAVASPKKGSCVINPIAMPCHSDEEEERLKSEQFTAWLNVIFESGPCVKVLESYVHNFKRWGAETPSSVQKYCFSSDFDDFAWMRPIHKRIFQQKYEATNAAINSNHKIDYEDENLKKARLIEWLALVFEGGPSKAVLSMYAENFIWSGLESKAVITKWCSVHDVRNFNWMKDLHKRRFLLMYKTQKEAG